MLGTTLPKSGSDLSPNWRWRPWSPTTSIGGEDLSLGEQRCLMGYLASFPCRIILMLAMGRGDPSQRAGIKPCLGRPLASPTTLPSNNRANTMNPNVPAPVQGATTTMQTWQGVGPDGPAGFAHLLLYSRTEHIGRHVVAKTGLPTTNGVVLAGNAPLVDIPKRIAALPAINFDPLWTDDDGLHFDCVVEVADWLGTHRFFIRATYSPDIGGNGALLSLCQANRLRPWPGDIAVVQLGSVVPYLVAPNAAKARIAVARFIRHFQWWNARGGWTPSCLAVDLKPKQIRKTIRA
ncbi:hypothetical protein HMN09_01070100 [Mycena chlorophos]|uniref:Uncharacterized protein n=1 Tax=Mycena chlorophos TaxID=658473 RepID=A0A8H6W263_MYCCL|nr:hypothetical protein HMN09_01070100 [Mycena chlorophos]